MIKSYPKNKPFRSKKAIEWFRTQPCHWCKNSGEGIVTGHHEPLKVGHGVSSKGPDDEQIPLCLICHTRREAIGKHSFYGIHNWKGTVKLYKQKVHEYLNGRKKK